MEQYYGRPSQLVYWDHIISSECGVQQGDPLGPALFCLVTHPLTSGLQSELNMWYLDDGSLADDADRVLEDFQTIVVQSKDLGLELNPNKCELYCTSGNSSMVRNILCRFQRIAPGIQMFPLENCTLLGAPLSSTATTNCLKSKTATLQTIKTHLHDLPTHCAFFILKNSQAIPKMTHVLRCSATWECPTDLASFDDTLRAALSTILNVELQEDTWQQASWPVAKGGLGVRRTSDIALPAFIASSYSSMDLVERILPPYVFSQEDAKLTTSLRLWTTAASSPLPPEDCRNVQKSWDMPLVQESIRNAMSHATHPSSKARLFSVAAPESGAFLHALPAAQLGTLLSDNEFRIATALRLGAALGQPHTCRCGTPVDTHDTHGLSCRRSAGRITRHAAINDILHRAFASAGFPSTLEPAFLSRDNNMRPDGVTLIPWREGKALAWDFTCGDSLAPSHLPFSSEIALHVATKAETNKTTKYAYLEPTHIFVPIAAECLGAFGKASMDFLRSLGRKMSSHSGDPRAFDHLMQRLSVALQRGNAQSIVGTLPQCATLDYDVS